MVLIVWTFFCIPPNEKGMALMLQELHLKARSTAAETIEYRGFDPAAKAKAAAASAASAEVATETMRAVFQMDARGGTGRTVMTPHMATDQRTRADAAVNEIKQRLVSEREEERRR